MVDLLFVALVFAFFGVAALLVRACDRIIGPDPVPLAAVDDPPSARPDEPIELVA
jgi:hypothetical protein